MGKIGATGRRWKGQMVLISGTDNFEKGVRAARERDRVGGAPSYETRCGLARRLGEAGKIPRKNAA